MKVLELFAGYGSQALALENLGIDFISDISEIDKYAIQAYNQLHGETHNWGDITKIDENELPYYDLITYSSPCQDFSTAGLQRGGDKGSGTRSSLLWECERIIRAVKPKYLLMENVKNLIGKQHRHNFDKWLDTLNSIGYNNYWQVLNAKDYGIPQNRERVFVVSIRKDLDTKGYKFPEKKPLLLKLKDVLELIVDEKYYLPQERVNKFLKSFEINQSGCSNTLATVQQIGNIIETDSFGGNPQCGRIYATNGCSPCLSTMQGGGREPKILCEGIANTPNKFEFNGFHSASPSFMVTDIKNVKMYSDGFRIRKLTPRECWRLMGVKDEQFNKLNRISNTQLYKMAGNSIVVDVLMSIFKNLFEE